MSELLSIGGQVRFRNRLRIKKNNSITRFERIRLALEELGTTFIKFGQIMSNRPDILPGDLIIELEKLRENVLPFSDIQAIEIIEKELNVPLSKHFKNFNPTPIGCASISQVHSAELISGEKVVIKILRPGITEIVYTDIEIMYIFAFRMKKFYKKIDNISIVGIIKEFERAIKKELDFLIEANNIERFAENFAKNTNIHTPKIYKNLSTKNILVMEYIDGFLPSDSEKFIQYNISPIQIAKIGTEAILEQIFVNGFFHADPHTGNLRIMPNGKLCFLDYGMMGRITPQWRMDLADFMLGFINRDVKKITDIVLKVTNKNDCSFRDDLEYEIFEMIEKYSYLDLKSINFSQMIQETISIIYQFELKVPPAIYLLAKTIMMVESIGRMLNPEFIMVEQIRPYAKKIVKERLSFKHYAKDSIFTINEILDLMKNLPKDIKTILNQFKSGNLKLKIEHEGLENFSIKFEQASNRFAYSIVLAALIVGSSIMSISKIPPFWNDIPIIGVLGFLISGIMGFILIFDILRHNKM